MIKFRFKDTNNYTNKDQKVYSINLGYILKYMGYSARYARSIVDGLTDDDPKNQYSVLINETDPYHIVRVAFKGEVPYLYTLSSKQHIAISRFLEVLEPINDLDIPEFYNKTILDSMLLYNTKVDKQITWSTQEEYENDLEFSKNHRGGLFDELEHSEIDESQWIN